MSDGETRPRHLTNADRSNSSSSITRASPGAKSSRRQPKAYTVGQSGLNAHSRNRSYGKNLNEAVKIAKAAAAAAGEDGAVAAPGGVTGGGTTSKGRKGGGGGRDRSKSPHAHAHGHGHVKRSSSTVSLPRTGSKASIKRNSSNVSLKRNGSSTRVNRASATSSRPTTPIRRNKSQSEDLDAVESKAAFEMEGDDDEDDNQDDDDEWTEESASQSPTLTRRSSTSRGGGKSGKSTPGEVGQQQQQHGGGTDVTSSTAALATSGTTSAPTTTKQPATPEPKPFPSPEHQKSHHPPDIEQLTSRLLSKGPTGKLDPKLTSVSATGTPGTQTPPPSSQRPPSSQQQQAIASQESATSSLGEPSLPSNGQSRFLNTAGASSSSRESPSAWHHLHSTGLGSGSNNSNDQDKDKDRPHRNRSKSPPNARDEAVRRARSAVDLTIASNSAPSAGAATGTGTANASVSASRPTVRQELDSRGQPSGAVTFEAPQASARRKGGYTAIKNELVRQMLQAESAAAAQVGNSSSQQQPLTPSGTSGGGAAASTAAAGGIGVQLPYRGPGGGGAGKAGINGNTRGGAAAVGAAGAGSKMPSAAAAAASAAAAAGHMSAEDKRMRLCAEADASLGFLMRFRNPLVEGARRAVKMARRRDKNSDAASVAAATTRSGQHSRAGSLTNGSSVNGDAGSHHQLGGHALAKGEREKRGRDKEPRGAGSRPVSRAGPGLGSGGVGGGPRNVRFEVGLDPGDEMAEGEADGGEQGDAKDGPGSGVETLLRSLWAGGEMEHAGD